MITPWMSGSASMRLHVRHAGHAEFLLESAALFLGAAIAGDDLELVRFCDGSGEHLGPAA